MEAVVRFFAKAVREMGVLSTSLEVEVMVPRAEVVRAIAELAKAVGRLHSGGHVHCDLNLSNTLITCEDVISIDALSVPVGMRAPAASPGWAAPEQVMGHPVSPATDVYPLGLMLVLALDAAVYGQIVQYVVAIGRSDRRIETLFKNPFVYIDHEAPPVPRSSVEDWQNLIRRCLMFEPNERYPYAATLSDEIMRLLEHAPPDGHFKFSVTQKPNSLCWLIDDRGRQRCGWVLHDDITRRSEKREHDSRTS